MYKVEQKVGQQCLPKAHENWRKTYTFLALLLLPLFSFSQNLLTNPSFENGLGGWSTVGENVSVSSDANTGNNAAQLCDNYIALTQVLPTQAGKVYQGSCFAKLIKREAGALSFNIRFLNSNYSPVGNFFPNLENSTSYISSSLENREAPAGAAFVQVIIEKVNDSFSGRGCIVVDDVVLEEVGGGSICDLSASIVTNECNDNGTLTDPSDDFSSPIIRVMNPSATGTSWQYRLADGSLSSKKQYGVPAALERASVSLNRQVEIIDVTDPSCTFTLSIASIPSCSEEGSDCTVDIEEVVIPSQVSPGEQISITVTLVNNATVMIPAAKIGFFRIVNGEFGTRVAQRIGDLSTTPALSGGERKRFTFQVDLPHPLYLEGQYPIPTTNFGSELMISTDANTGFFQGLPTCYTTVETKVKYPNRDLKVEFVNNKGCYGNDGRVKADIEISNAGNQTILAPIYVYVNTFDFIRRDLPEVIGQGLLGISYIKIDQDLAPEESAIIEEPLQFPDGFSNEYEFTVQVEEVASNINDTNAFNNEDRITISQDPNCGGTIGGGKIDIELDFDSAEALRRYKTTRCTFTVSNEGESAASGVQVAVPIVAGQVVVSGSSNTVVSKGSYNPYGSQIWNVGDLAPGESATLEISLFFLAADLQLFSEVIAATGSDVDSSPNNGNGTSPREDDEVLLTYGNPPSGKADIKVSFISGENYDIIQPFINSLKVRLQNIGQTASTGFKLKAYLSQDNILSPATDTEIGMSDESSFAAGASADRTISIFVPNLIMTGDYYLIFDAAGSDLVDVNLANNRVSKLINVANDNFPCDIDINVGEITCDNANTPNNPNDDTFTVRIRPVKNSGGVAVRFTVNGDNQSYSYGEEVEVGPFLIADGATSILVQDVFIGDAANCMETAVVPAPAPCSTGSSNCRMLLTNLNIPASVEPGGTLTGTATITNLTTESRVDNILQLRRLTPGGNTLVIGGVNIGNFAPNETRNVTFKIDLPEQLYLIGGFPLERPYAGNSLELKLSFNNCSTPIDLTVDNPVIDLELTAEGDGCVGDDNIVQTDLKVTNRGNLTTTRPIYVRLPEPQYLDLSRSELFTNNSSQYGFWKIEQNLAPGESATLTRPLTVPSDFQSNDFAANLQAYASNVFDPNGNNDRAIFPAMRRADCGGNNGSNADLSLSITSDNPTVGVYQRADFTFTVTNSGDQAARDISINIPKPDGNFVISGNSTPMFSQGYFSRFLGQGAWNVGTLGAGESATLKINLFFLQKPFVYAEIYAASGFDPDSSPGNGDGQNANEDDEAVFGGQIGNNCNIILTTYGKQCDNSGTPNDPSDDTFTFKYKATATNGSEGYTVDAFNTGEIISPAFQIYGLEYTSPIIPISDGLYELTVRDQANQICSTSLDITPPNTCSDGGGGTIDLEIAVSPDASYQQYVHTNVTYTVTNTGTATAENVSVTMTTPAGTANTSFFEASQGDFSLFNAKWTIGKIAAGQSVTLTRRFFPLLNDKRTLSGFAHIATASPTDVDSTPGNNGTLEDTAEDDDIVFFIPVANLQAPTTGDLLSQNDGNIKLYPTVTNGVLNLEMTSVAGSADLIIVNTQGQTVQVLKMDLVKGFNQKTLDVSRLIAGTYFIQIVTANSQETLRFVKIK